MITEPGFVAPEALLQLEKRLDSAPFRLATSVARLAVQTRGAWLRHRPLPTPPSLKKTEAASSVELASRLGLALKHGALESVDELANRLLPRVGELPPHRLRPAIAALIEARMTYGARDQAVALSRAHADLLSQSLDGAGMLTALGHDGAPLWLEGGLPNLLAWNQRLRTSADLVELTAGLGGRVWPWLRLPDLYLVYFNALARCDSARAIAFLNRYLAMHGLSACSANAALASPLDVAFEPVSPRDSGPLVSIVIAAYNAASTIGRAVDSLLAQSYAPLEVLVGDDASTDGTLEVLRARYGQEPRVRLFRSRQNQGAYNLRNALFAEARGELLTCHDADDIALPRRIALQAGALRTSGAIACVGNWLRVHRERGVVVFKDQAALRLALVTLMVRRSAHQALGPFRSARVGADLERFTQLQQRFGKSALVRVRKPLVWAEWSDGSATRQLGTEALEDGFRSTTRRAYSQLIYEACQADAAPSNADIDARLQALGNWKPASAIDVVHAHQA